MAVVLFILMFILMIFWFSCIIYFFTGLGKKFYHDILLWHRPDSSSYSDGSKCRCKYCGKILE